MEPKRISAVEDVLSGKVEISDFMERLRNDPELLDTVEQLMPADARENTEHSFWKGFSKFSDLATVSSLQILTEAYQYAPWDKLGGDLDAADALCRMYCYWFPNIAMTTMYKERYSLFLNAVGDYFEGPDVAETLCTIIEQALKEKTKKAQNAVAKALIAEQFHLEGRKRPYWIQGAEWPMGVNSPMKYLSKKRNGEQVTYTFQDVDTLEIREVVQFY